MLSSLPQAVSDRLHPSNLGWALAIAAVVTVVIFAVVRISEQRAARSRHSRVEALAVAHPHAEIFDLRILRGATRRDQLQGEGPRLRDIPSETTFVADDTGLTMWQGSDAPVRAVPWRAVASVVEHSDPEFPSHRSELQIRLVEGGRYQGFVAQGNSTMLPPSDVRELAARLTKLSTSSDR